MLPTHTHTHTCNCNVQGIIRVCDAVVASSDLVFNVLVDQCNIDQVSQAVPTSQSITHTHLPTHPVKQADIQTVSQLYVYRLVHCHCHI